ncbi:hypothetical protein [Variovorax sp. UC74_104]|uniref:hypothetical protein n=1 Tax=Variovorax sp. UC74_104 TaxID=3374555 RepID=UPI00375756C1
MRRFVEHEAALFLCFFLSFFAPAMPHDAGHTDCRCIGPSSKALPVVLCRHIVQALRAAGPSTGVMNAADAG